VEPSDEELCWRVANRDEAAFDRLVERYQQRAYRLAWSIVRDAEEARDLSQEAFIRLFEGAASFAGRARFSTWFHRILVNLCLDHRRRHRWWRQVLSLVSPTNGSEPSIIEQAPAPLQDPVEDIGRVQDMRELWAAVDRLSPRQRAAVLLHVQEELPTAEIAAVLDCSETTVRVHLHRALTTLRKTIGSAARA